jgi:ribosomal protein S18 acetylase RimI-like enzyme
MVAVPLVAGRDTRPLRADDVERVIAVDRAYSGQSRRRFFEKRFAAAKAQPEDFIHVGVVQDGALRGYAIARVLRGEFGHKQAVAVLDAIGVDAESRERGVGQALMAELDAIMVRRNVRALQSQAEWTNLDLLRFFAAAGFQLAPRLTLQRPVAALLDELSEQV